MAMTAYFLEQAGGELNDIKLAKLQYLAERYMLVHYGKTLTGDRGVSLHHGPCLSETLYLTNDTKDDAEWDEHFGFELHMTKGKEDNRVLLLNPVDYTQVLTDAEIDAVRRMWNAHGHVDTWQLRRWCHETCTEYAEVESGKWAWIDLEKTFEAEGCSPDHAKQIVNEIRTQERFDDICGYAAVS